MTEFSAILRDRLDDLRRASRCRVLRETAAASDAPVNLSGNDYLGITSDAELDRIVEAMKRLAAAC